MIILLMMVLVLIATVGVAAYDIWCYEKLGKEIRQIYKECMEAEESKRKQIEEFKKEFGYMDASSEEFQKAFRKGVRRGEAGADD